MGEILSGLVAVVFIALGVMFATRKHERKKARERDAEAERKTRERMDEVDLGNDPDLARRWLHERQRARDMHGDD